MMGVGTCIIFGIRVAHAGIISTDLYFLHVELNTEFGLQRLQVTCRVMF